MKNSKGFNDMEVNSIYQYGNFSIEDYQRLSLFIHDNFGINLPENKLPLVQSRLQRRLIELEIPSYKAYCDFVFSKEGQQSEIIPLMDVISTNKTDFFRENSHFDFIIHHIFHSEVYKNKNIRIWSAGSSSGEEAYTLAMVMMDLLEKGKVKDFSIYGSDISTKVLNIAAKAIYPYQASNEIPEHYRKKYLLKSKDGKHIRIVKDLRTKVHFSRLNLMDDHYPFNAPFDLVFCRNTLIYFTKQTQESVINKVLNHMDIGGHLVIGHSESLLNMDLPAERIKATIYKKLPHIESQKKEELK